MERAASSRSSAAEAVLKLGEEGVAGQPGGGADRAIGAPTLR